MQLEDALRSICVVPVITISDADLAAPLVEAVAAAEIPCAEITFRTTAGAAALRTARATVPDILLGAGTILEPDQVDEAIEAGATFIVSPGFNSAVVHRCQSLRVPIIPGVATPTEIEMARSAGLRLMKFFPAESGGGVAYLKAMSAPYPDVSFVPTGGIDLSNLASYLALPNVAACGGSWMVGPALIDRRDFEGIRRRTADAVATVRSVRPSIPRSIL